jgi:hypothetical protein
MKIYIDLDGDFHSVVTPDYQGTWSRQCHPAQAGHAEQRCQTSRAWDIRSRSLGSEALVEHCATAAGNWLYTRQCTLCECSVLSAFLLQISPTTALSGSNFEVFLEATIHHVSPSHSSS